ncbi:hypothetical protein PVK62_17195 [Aliivibrio sp. S3MY1]|uniref:hypothetical protein n=1 Tax=unclassified Aliivibrio TaxID=2645654 RepID=UPI002379CE27|nr:MULTISPECIES: hypothetical protein [unclassified Aliivibrio]MDD9197559.1 hypothetical protein [Aliivibrio sp. S3MY1]MDD9200812.1 hypothetical protein [Aliivibrio sp. S2MY1]
MALPVNEPELAVSLVLLYDFAPFISVVIAINFVSSFWDGVKNKAIDSLDAERDNLISELNAVYKSGDCLNSDSVKELDKEAQEYKVFLTYLSNIATVLGIIIVVILFVLLAYIGFEPKYKMTEFTALIMIAVSILPSTLFRCLGSIYSRNSIKKLKKTSETMKTAARAAIKDNEKAAYK